MREKLVLGQLYNLYLKCNEDKSTFTVQGKSMLPAFKDGCKVRAKAVETKDIDLGNVVIFANNGLLICHRIIGKFRWNSKLYFIHKGDFATAGGVFEEKDLVGKIIEAADADGKKIDKNIWQRSFNPSLKIKIASYIYLLLFLIKKVFFDKSKNRLFIWAKRYFWRLYPVKPL